MEPNEEDLRTVAILELQSSVLTGYDEQWHRLADRLSQRLCHPVVVLPRLESEDRSDKLESLIEWYANQGFHRMVVLPFGLESFDLTALRNAVVWSRRSNSRIAIHVAARWSIVDWSNVLYSAVCDSVASILEENETENRSPKLSLLLIADRPTLELSHDLPKSIGSELACLAHELLQHGSEIEIRFAFFESMRPSLADIFGRMDAEQIQQVVLIPWRMDDDRIVELFRTVGSLHAIEIVAPSLANAWYWNRMSHSQPMPICLLDHASAIHTLFEKYLQALATRSVESYFEQADGETTTPIRRDLIALDQRVDSMLPSEYRGRTDEVPLNSMGSASLIYDVDGRVAWDKIWTSFCDLAMAGGPPHRGKLLEAVTSEQVLQNVAKYEEVANEIRRGIESVTGLQTEESAPLGWVGILCDNESMAVWLMRAIIVENVMVRREKTNLYVPAGPDFTLKREIKNVITSVAKSVHYWRAHLKTRPQPQPEN